MSGIESLQTAVVNPGGTAPTAAQPAAGATAGAVDPVGAARVQASAFASVAPASTGQPTAASGVPGKSETTGGVFYPENPAATGAMRTPAPTQQGDYAKAVAQAEKDHAARAAAASGATAGGQVAPGATGAPSAAGSGAGQSTYVPGAGVAGAAAGPGYVVGAPGAAAGAPAAAGTSTGPQGAAAAQTTGMLHLTPMMQQQPRAAAQSAGPAVATAPAQALPSVSNASTGEMSVGGPGSVGVMSAGSTLAPVQPSPLDVLSAASLAENVTESAGVIRSPSRSPSRSPMKETGAAGLPPFFRRLLDRLHSLCSKKFKMGRQLTELELHKHELEQELMQQMQRVAEAKAAGKKDVPAAANGSDDAGGDSAAPPSDEAFRGNLQALALKFDLERVTLEADSLRAEIQALGRQIKDEIASASPDKLSSSIPSHLPDEFKARLAEKNREHYNGFLELHTEDYFSLETRDKEIRRIENERREQRSRLKEFPTDISALKDLIRDVARDAKNVKERARHREREERHRHRERERGRDYIDEEEEFEEVEDDRPRRPKSSARRRNRSRGDRSARRGGRPRTGRRTSRGRTTARKYREPVDSDQLMSELESSRRKLRSRRQTGRRGSSTARRGADAFGRQRTGRRTSRRTGRRGLTSARRGYSRESLYEDSEFDTARGRTGRKRTTQSRPDLSLDFTALSGGGGPSRTPKKGARYLGGGKTKVGAGGAGRSAYAPGSAKKKGSYQKYPRSASRPKSRGGVGKSSSLPLLRHTRGDEDDWY